MAQKKKEPGYGKSVGWSMVLLLLWISDRILYPTNAWDLIRIVTYVVMVIILGIIIREFIKLSKAGRKQ